MSVSTLHRAIDDRFLPPVAGIDLEQALNYVDLDAAGVAFVYDHYTSGRTFYRMTTRPRLEQVVSMIATGCSGRLEAADRLAKWVATNIRWAGYHRRDHGHRLPTDTAPSEEQLLDRGYGWCNEQARLFCALAQIAGIPSRLVFAFNKALCCGHVISEVLLDDGKWMAVDQSFGFCFTMVGKPIRVTDIYGDPAARAYFSPQYGQQCRRLIDDLGLKEVQMEFTMAALDEPIEGFVGLGFHNYYLH